MLKIEACALEQSGDNDLNRGWLMSLWTDRLSEFGPDSCLST
jgi:hypothetical protein